MLASDCTEAVVEAQLQMKKTEGGDALESLSTTSERVGLEQWGLKKKEGNRSRSKFF